MLRVKVKNTILADFRKLSKAESDVVADKLVVALAAATPKDTGRAAAGWRRDEKGNIVNDVEYIDDLNDGHSKQAAPRFIEATVLSQENVLPNGTIVRTPT